MNLLDIIDLSVFGLAVFLFLFATILTFSCKRKIIEDEPSEDIHSQFPEVEAQNTQ